jgi:hypothetical protein
MRAVWGKQRPSGHGIKAKRTMRKFRMARPTGLKFRIQGSRISGDVQLMLLTLRPLSANSPSKIFAP